MPHAETHAGTHAGTRVGKQCNRLHGLRRKRDKCGRRRRRSRRGRSFIGRKRDKCGRRRRRSRRGRSFIVSGRNVLLFHCVYCFWLVHCYIILLYLSLKSKGASAAAEFVSKENRNAWVS
jgi:hypothetical protein